MTKTKRTKLTSKVLMIVLCCMLVIGLAPVSVFAANENLENTARTALVTFSGGTGTTEDPYKISSADELKAFAEKVNSGETGLCGILISNINLNPGITFKENGTYTGGIPAQWTPIGTNAKNYTGTFDGNGHVISGLYINNNDADYQGLFGGSTGTIQNLGIENSYICAGEYVGGIVGRNGKGSIINCYNTGSIIGQKNTGGIAGYSYYLIQDCYNTGAIIGNGNTVGGIAGHSNNILKNCYNTGAITGGNDTVGGIAGSCYGTVENCYNTGAITGTGSAYASIGGIAGTCGSYSIAGIVQNCYNTGVVNGTTQYVGGIIGNNGRKGDILNSYNLSNVIGQTETGGITGLNSGNIAYCYNLGDVTGSVYVGGICGKLAENSGGGTVQFSYNVGNVASTSSETIPYPVAGNCSGKYRIENTYYVSDVEKDDGGKTKAQFASGEIAWLLNGDQTNLVWKQNLNSGEIKDDYPSFIGANVYKVNKYATCNKSDTPIDAYSNVNTDIAGAHSLIKHNANPATCTENGNIEYWLCDTCGKCFSDESLANEIAEKETVIKATGHNYKDGKCTVCGKADPNYVPEKPVKPDNEGDHNTPNDIDDKNENIDLPKTGDNSNIGLWIAVMLAAVCTFACSFFYSRKRKHN